MSKTGKTITIQRDIATRTDTNGMSDSQTYTFTPDPNGATYIARLGQKGWKILGGSRILVGYRHEYFDYSF